ncbi:MAG TPA: hypothetical protein VKH64_11355 [Candidatus Binatia bacterium]|nr:hypothetical protein [Candidatus Binatia bacterium]
MKKLMPSCVLASALLLAVSGAAFAQYGAQPYGSPAPYGQPNPYAPATQPGGTMTATVFAALVAAYEEYARYSSSRGVALTPREIVARNYGVQYSQPSPDRLRVVFLPNPPTGAGGDVGYVVDLRTLQIVERFFGR